MNSTIRILLADDHALVRESLKFLLANVEDMQVAQEAINGEEVLKLLQNWGLFDIILLDLNMPGLSGPDLVGHVCAQEGVPPVLVLSMHDDPLIVRQALAKGAAGYLTKDNHPDVLIQAIRKVAAGGRYLDPALAQAMAFLSTQTSVSQSAYDNLSERERQILALLARGLSVNDIAEQLCISNKTVSTHKARLMEKMSFSSNVDLVKYAITQRLVD